MQRETTNLEELLQQSLKEFEMQRGQPLAPEVWEIVQHNLQKKRLQFFLDKNLDESAIGYVQRVAKIYEHLHIYLYQLQVEKSDEIWEPLVKKMEGWAYSFLMKKGFVPSKATWELAHDYSIDAMMALVKAYFPYDIAFDAWAIVLLQHTCRKHLRDEGRRLSNKGGQEFSIEEEKLANLPDAVSDGQASRLEQRHDLWQAIQKLDLDAQEVLRMYYFEDLKPAEIAAQMGKSPSQVYMIKFQALKSLIKILGAEGYE